MNSAVTASWPTTPVEDGRSQPVFVISWPHSGQERILAALDAHPDILTIMDAGPAQAQRRSHVDRPRGADELGALDDTQVQIRRSRYWKALQNSGQNVGNRTVLDAMWLTVESLPTIARLFPGARILFIGRDPRDMTVGWMRGGYAHLDIMAQCYTAQLALLDMCRASLPLQFIDVNYDRAVEDPEGVLGAVVDGLGLSWDDAVLAKFEATPMPVEVQAGDYVHYSSPNAGDRQGTQGSESIH